MFNINTHNYKRNHYLTSAHHHTMHLLATSLTIAVLLLNTLAQYMPQDDGQDNYDYDDTDYTDLIEAQTNAADLRNLIYRLDLVPCGRAKLPGVR